MRNTYTVDAIKETLTYKELESKKEIAKCAFLTQRLIREKISHAVAVFNNTGSIPGTVSGIYLQVVLDFCTPNIPNLKEVDYSSVMTAENLDL